MIGIFGGTGFYSFLGDVEKREIETKYGKPSSPVTIGKIGNHDVAFIARHGEHHEFPPHKIPYKANIYALKELGVTRIIAPSAVGSLRPDIKPGDFVVPDQFVNFTCRDDTFYDKPVTHISAADPYCPGLRKKLIEKSREMKFPLHESGTMIVVQGPRFSSRAESNYFRQLGDIINMTQYPELILARELEICYANISIVTDYDTGVKNDAGSKAVTLEEVIRVFKENNEKIRQLIFSLVLEMPQERKCTLCPNALQSARF